MKMDSRRGVPITEMQRALSAPSIVVASTVRLEGDVSVAHVLRAAHELCRHHAALRTTLDLETGLQHERSYGPDAVGTHVVVTDASKLIEDLAPHCHREIDAGTLPVFHCVVAADADETVLAIHLVAPHALSDRTSMQLLFRDLFACLRAYRDGTDPVLVPPAVSFNRHLAHRHALLSDSATWAAGGRGTRAVRFWEELLKGAGVPRWNPPSPTGIPLRRSAGSSTTNPMAFVRGSLKAPTRDRLIRLASDIQASLLHVLVAGYEMTIAEVTGHHDVATTCLIHGRGRSAVRHTVGMFVEEVVFRHTAHGLGILDRVRNVRADALRAYLHQDIPLGALSYRSRIIAMFYLRRRYGDMILQFRPQQIVQPGDEPIPGVDVSLLHHLDGMVGWRLPGYAVLSVDDRGHELSVELMFDQGAWDEAQMRHVLNVFVGTCSKVSELTLAQA